MQLNAQELEKLTMTVQDMLQGSGASTYFRHAMGKLEREQGVRYVAQLLTFTPTDLLRVPNIGGNTCMDIINILAVNGLRAAALEDYKDELLVNMRVAFPSFVKREAEMADAAIVSMNDIKAQAFGKYLLSVEEKPLEQDRSVGMAARSDKPECLADWFHKYVSPAVQSLLARSFERSVIGGSTMEGRVGLAIHAQPRMA